MKQESTSPPLEAQKDWKTESSVASEPDSLEGWTSTRADWS
jgi:hypothetical protein